MRLLAAMPITLLVAACAPSRDPVQRFNLDRPVEIEFTCHGDLRLTGGGPAQGGEEIIRSAQPVTACQSWLAGQVPEGQEDVEADQDAGIQAEDIIEPSFAGFALQPTEGAVAVVSFGANPSGAGLAAVIDSDPLTPGKNSIPIGTLPVDIAMTPGGCHLMSANAGTCDLSALDVDSALDLRVQPRVDRLLVRNAGGEVIRARPTSMVAEPAGGPIGVACPAQPEGLLYIAYPDCNMIGVVDAATGTLSASIQFDDQGTATIGDGNVSCAAQCRPMDSIAMLGGGGDGGLPDAGPGGPDAGPGGPDAGPGSPPAPLTQPLTLHLATIEVPVSGQDPSLVTRLFISSIDSPIVTVVNLGADRLPSSSFQIALEGDVGVRKLAASPLVNVGGATGTLGAGAGSRFQYVYAIATDDTIRVLEVHNLRAECDAAVDPRFLEGIADVSFLACMPVGDARTPSRRAGRTSPGIRLPYRNGDGEVHPAPVPLDVAFTTATVPPPPQTNPDDPPSRPPVAATNMVGVFAFASASNGRVYVINVDDDNYPDFEVANDPLAVWMSLAVPHQVRDLGTERDAIAAITEGPTCGFPQANPEIGGPRLAQPLAVTLPEGRIAPEKLHLLPFVRSFDCDGVELPEGVTVPVSELSFAAPLTERARVYPDLLALPVSETWAMTWEGTVSLDGSSSRVDGPQTRVGYVDPPQGDRFVLNDAGGPFCAMGIEDYDIAVLRGCDITRGNGECGLGETCYVHPDTPSGARGMCLPSDEVDRLSSVCRDLLVSRRRYTVYETFADHVVLGVRRRKLETTPPTGCVDASHCEDLDAIAREIAVADHPRDIMLDPDEPQQSWVCEPDPTRAPGPATCLATCNATADCEAGWSCSGGYCVEGPLPPGECVESLQRYQARVGEAFAMLGTQTGFLHHRIVDEDTGMCVDDPDGNPLLTGRLPLAAPPCTGDGLTDLEPNPCQTTVEHAEQVQLYSDAQTCEPGEVDVRVRSVEAIRFRNPLFNFHLVDPVTTGDMTCREDRGGAGEEFSAVFPGYQVAFSLTAGHIAFFVPGINAAWPATVIKGPDGGIWVLDSGDPLVSGLGRLRGQMFRIDPDAAGQGFAPNILR